MAEQKKLTGDNRIDFGWFSRRHQSVEKHADAVSIYQEQHGPVARKSYADMRTQERASRSPQEQLVLLDKRGRRAIKERARLSSLIGQK